MKQVWPDSFVEEANLSHHIFTLRKALGEEKHGVKFIETLPAAATASPLRGIIHRTA